MSNFENFLMELFNISNINVKNTTNFVKNEFKDYIENFYELGSYRDPMEDSIAFFAVELSKESTRDRARTMQRNLIASVMKNRHNVALVAFYEPNSEDWRFSYVKVGYEFNEKGLVEKLSSPKRHSFLVGLNEPNHTCEKQFLNLLISEERISLEQIENAFSIENVTGEFFNEYKRLFLDLADSLREVKDNDPIVSEEFESKNIKSSDFAKKLMGQLVFIYFLQKKGWLGVELNNDWGTGPKNFLRKIFEQCQKEGKNFFNDVLEHLFYEGLSEEVGDCHYTKFGFKVPFLNGGLFEPINNYDWIKTDVVLDNNIFSEILDTFDKFNFTVKEDEPLEKEVAVDPEMLGKVFENLLEVNDRKSKGAFYTPRHIVHYMCQQNLISYLEANSNVSKEDLKKFITEGDIAVNSIIRANEEKKKYHGKQFTKISLPDSIKENADELENLLKTVKVVDPAVGSGAFPVGMMNEIVKARYILRLLNEIDDINMYDLKRETIENSLYGVDLELSATDVTKLRFWLSLVVDEEDIKYIKPLPNLDNQIMCGNSLIEGFEDIKLFDDSLIHRSEQRTLVVSPLERIFNELESKKREYFNTSGPIAKLEIKKEIDQLKWDFLETHLKSIGKSSLIEPIKTLYYQDSKPFFIWELEFSEIFKGKNPGFDIVIGNPPYVGEKGNREIFREIKKTAWGNRYYQSKMDLLYYFFHKGLDICKNEGFVSFITTNYFLTADGAVKLREDFKKRTNILSIINFNELRIFESARGQHNAITFLNKSNEKNVEAEIYNLKTKGDLNEQLFNKILNKEYEHLNYIELSQEECFSGKDNLIFLEGHGQGDINSTEYLISNILKKLENEMLLKNIVIINGGANVPLSVIKRKQIENFEGSFKKGEGVFVLTDDELTEKNFPADEMKIIKPFIKNSDIVHYYVKKPTKHLLYIDGNTEINKFPKIKEHLLRFKPILVAQRQRYGEKNSWYELHRPGDEKFFLSEKIVLPYRSKENNFAYSDNPLYASRDVFYMLVKNNDYDIKYLLALLNSKLYYLWLYYRGKRKGEILELYVTPVENIPIKQISKEEQRDFIKLVDQLILLKQEFYESPNTDKQNLNQKINDIVNEIDYLVYELYDLTDEEIDLIENSKE